MDIKITIIVNIVLWLFTLYLRFQARKVILKFKSMKTYGLTGLFIVFGILMYIKYPNYIMILNFISFACAGFILNTCPSGFGKKGILMLGRLHKYKNIKKYEKKKREGQWQLEFTSKRKTYHLYIEDSQVHEVDKYLKKIGGSK